MVESNELLLKDKSSLIASTSNSMSVYKLEQDLLKKFPRADAEDWDKTGLIVGDASQVVGKVCVALDVTHRLIDFADKNGVNVIITHHPVFIEPPNSFLIAGEESYGEGSLVYHAIQKNINLLNFHTALDISVVGNHVLPNMLRLHALYPLVRFGDDENKGYGQVCVFDGAGTHMTLQQLSARCVAVFKRTPRVWGDPSCKISRVATFSGSVNSFEHECLKEKINCLICGEIKYHTALRLAEYGISIIELGHDISELPYTTLLALNVVEAGIDEDNVLIFDQSNNWMCPDSIRL